MTKGSEWYLLGELAAGLWIALGVYMLTGVGAAIPFAFATFVLSHLLVTAIRES